MPLSRKRSRSNSRRRFLGLFDIGGRQVAGELTLKGAGTLLKLHDTDTIAHVEQGVCVYGSAYSGEHITLINCRSPGPGLAGFPDGRKIYHTEVFPYYVVLGRGYIQPSEPCIRAIHFTSTDLMTLFYDFDAFSTVIDARPIIDAVLQERRQLRSVESGERPLVCYFTGRERIVEVQTAIGRVSVYHSPSYNLGGPGGVYIRNRIGISIEPETPVAFDQALERMHDLASFLSMTAGRRQGLNHIHMVTTYGTDESPLYVEAHPSYRTKDPKDLEQYKPHPADVPLDPIRHAEEFRAVLTDWLHRHERWRAARVRYLDCLRKDDVYDADRLIAAANTFDILPADAVPGATALSTDLAATKNACEILFRLHPRGIDRNSALSALGRLGQPSLPKKVLHRVAIVDAVFESRFPDLAFVASTAVKCRNFLVHGSDEIGVAKIEHLFPFVTDALEFIFAASDFIDAGWDARRWNSLGHSWGHSFARFRGEYNVRLAQLRQAIKA